MTGFDTPPRAEQPQKLDSVSERLMDSIFNLPSNSDVRSISEGSVALMRVPEGWKTVGGDDQLPLGVRSLGCRPGDNDRVEVNIFNSGTKLTKNTADAFRQILQAGPHSLSDSEIEKLGDLMGQTGPQNPDFKMTSARTLDLHGKKVVAVEGRFQKWNVDTTMIFASRDDNSTQQISYTAPSSVYDKYLPDARRSIDSIVWK